jgi:uncharacterized membrane-anchored protein
MKIDLSTQTSQMLSKVPEVTIIFWIIKIMGTTVGETAADFLSVNLHLGLTGTSFIMGVLLLVSIFIQIRYKKYVPWIYWITVVLISIFGTLITDDLVDNFGVSLQMTTVLFSLALLVTFIAWYASEKTLSIHSIHTSKRELFYWAAILFTFALGTASGDLAAEGWRWGYARAGLVFATLIGVVTMAHYLLKLNAILSFWIAYILTRPLGASYGDLLTQPIGNGGFGLDTSVISISCLLTILGLVVYLTMSQNKLAAQKPALAVYEQKDHGER